MLRAAGVLILYHSVVADVLREGDRVTGVVLANKAGLSVVKPKPSWTRAAMRMWSRSPAPRLR